MGWFRRKRNGPLTPEEMLAEGRDGQVQPTAEGVASSDFRMEVVDVFSIKGRGVVVTGTVTAGSIAVGATVGVSRNDAALKSYRVEGVETFRKRRSQAGVGESVGLLLADADRRDLQSGDLVTGS